MSLAATLWQANDALAARILSHGFVRGLADGSLPLASFRRYVAQDAYFLEAFARAYGACLAASRRREDLQAFAGLIAGVIEELRLHQAYAARWQVDLDGIVPTGATAAYVGFLERTAAGGRLGEIIAAMTPCMRLYAFLGQNLARGAVAPRYADWVATYASESFEALAGTLEELLDRHGRDDVVVRSAYQQAMQLELEFFDASL